MCTAWEVPPARSDELCNSTKARWGLAPNDRDQIAFEDGTRRARARVPKAGRAALEKIGRGYRAGGSLKGLLEQKPRDVGRCPAKNRLGQV